MKKIIWFEVFGFIDEDDEDYGTETKETFDTLAEAEKYTSEHKNQTLFIDEWEMNEDGSGVAKRKF